MDEIEKAVLDYLESRNDGWRWYFGTKTFTKEETIRLFKKDKQFRKMVKEQIYKLAVELFTKGAQSK